MSLIDDVKRDREAGTDGPFSVSGVRSSVTIYGHQVDAPSLAGIAWVGYESKHHASCWADVNRLARVPDLESALLAADELAKAADASFHWLEATEGYGNSAVSVNLRAALSTYRNAVEGK